MTISNDSVSLTCRTALEDVRCLERMMGDLRDHLFISYASEDGKFAEWISLRLAAAGYKVWCDRTHLLGGESYPKDIDRAIKETSFRVLALLSHASLAKPNPLKERTLALSIARERRTDFLIPLNVDGLSATELDWMTSDLTFIPFWSSWAVGFAQLLKKLTSINAPCNAETGRRNVVDWMAVRADPDVRQETLVANLLPIIEVPVAIHKFELQEKLILPKIAQHWSFYHPSESNFLWSFDPPEQALGIAVRKVETVNWQWVPTFDGLKMEDIALAILRKALTARCLAKGLRLVPGSRSLYLPDRLFPENHLRFTNYDGKKTYVKVVGERTFRSGESRERIRYHISPNFRVISGRAGEWVVRVSIHLHLTDLSGQSLEGSKVTARRKRICKSWWNHEWFSRFMAVVEWLTDGKEECELLSTSSGRFRISSKAVAVSAEQGIDESRLGAAPLEDEGAEIDEGAEGLASDIGDIAGREADQETEE